MKALIDWLNQALPDVQIIPGSLLEFRLGIPD